MYSKNTRQSVTLFNIWNLLWRKVQTEHWKSSISGSSQHSVDSQHSQVSKSINFPLSQLAPPQFKSFPKIQSIYISILLFSLISVQRKCHIYSLLSYSDTSDHRTDEILLHFKLFSCLKIIETNDNHSFSPCVRLVSFHAEKTTFKKLTT